MRLEQMKNKYFLNISDNLKTRESIDSTDNLYAFKLNSIFYCSIALLEKGKLTLKTHSSKESSF